MDYKPVSVLLVGNKCDRNLQRSISEEEGRALANEAAAHYFETSSELDLNITQVFTTAAAQMLQASVGDAEDIFASESPCCQCFDRAVSDPADLLHAVSGDDAQGRYKEDDELEAYIGVSDEVTECCEWQCDRWAAFKKRQQRTSDALDELIELVNTINESFD